MDMGTVTEAMRTLGAGDDAIRAMGPVLTILFAWLGGYSAAQFAKFPLAVFVGDPWHGYATRMIGVFTTFCFAHYLSDHLSVPLEVLTAIMQPTVYALGLAAILKFAPWIVTRMPFLGSVSGSIKP